MEEITLPRQLQHQEHQLKLPDSKSKQEKALNLVGYFFSLLFIYAGLRKIIDYKMFINEIEVFPLLAKTSIFPVIHKIGGKTLWLIIILESSASALLMNKKWILKGLYLTFGIITIITCYLFGILQFSKQIPIFFGSIFPHVSLYGHILVSISLLFLSLWALLYYK